MTSAIAEKYIWIVLFHLPDDRYLAKEMFDSEQEAKDYAAKHGEDRPVVKQYTPGKQLTHEENRQRGYCGCDLADYSGGCRVQWLSSPVAEA